MKYRSSNNTGRKYRINSTRKKKNKFVAATIYTQASKQASKQQQQQNRKSKRLREKRERWNNNRRTIYTTNAREISTNAATSIFMQPNRNACSNTLHMLYVCTNWKTETQNEKKWKKMWTIQWRSIHAHAKETRIKRKTHIAFYLEYGSCCCCSSLWKTSKCTTRRVYMDVVVYVFGLVWVRIWRLCAVHQTNFILFYFFSGFVCSNHTTFVCNLIRKGGFRCHHRYIVCHVDVFVCSVFHFYP